MKKFFPFIMLAGMTCIVTTGLWVTKTYEMYSVYPSEVYFYFLIGIVLVLLAFLLARVKGEEEAEDRGDYRVVINEIWENKKFIGDQVAKYVLIALGVLAIFNWRLALSLIVPIILLGLIVTGFLYVMHDDGEDVEWGKPKNKFIQIVLPLVDYRRHPFSITFVLFIVIIFSLLILKHYGIPISLDDRDRPRRYTTSLENQLLFMPAVIYTTSFLYIIQHADFLGIRRANQSATKLVFLYAFEFLICSLSIFLFFLGLI